jgi:hypothetical protein
MMTSSDAHNIYSLYTENAQLSHETQKHIASNGAVSYWRNGWRHREDGPALEWPNGTKMWYRSGSLHRDDGPAVVYDAGTKEWWLHNQRYSTAEAWAVAILKDKKLPHTNEHVQQYLRKVLTKDDLL